jgi:hypothetical protein
MSFEDSSARITQGRGTTGDFFVESAWIGIPVIVAESMAHLLWAEGFSRFMLESSQGPMETVLLWVLASVPFWMRWAVKSRVRSRRVARQMAGE